MTEAIEYAREHPGEVLELFLTEAAAAKHPTLARAAFGAGIEVTQVTERAAAALSDAVHPQGIVVRCAHPQVTVADVLAGGPRLIAVLVEAGDPGNAGTVIRLADAAGADGVIIAGNAVDPFNPKTIRASAGSLFHLPIAQAPDPAALLDELSAAGLSVLATSGAAELDLDAAAADGILDLPTAWLFGSEAHGLPERPAGAGRRGGAGADLRSRRVAQPGHRCRDLPVRQRGCAAQGGGRLGHRR